MVCSISVICRLLKEVMLSVQEGSSFEVMHDTVFFLVDSTVLSPFDWINSSRAPLFMVAKVCGAECD